MKGRNFFLDINGVLNEREGDFFQNLIKPAQVCVPLFQEKTVTSTWTELTETENNSGPWPSLNLLPSCKASGCSHGHFPWDISHGACMWGSLGRQELAFLRMWEESNPRAHPMWPEEMAWLIFWEGSGHEIPFTDWIRLLSMIGTLLVRSIICVIHCQPWSKAFSKLSSSPLLFIQ